MHDIISIKIPIYIQYYDNENNITNKKISDKIIKLKLTNDLKLYEILNSTIQTLFNYSIEWIKKNNYNVKLASFIIVDLNKQIRFFKCFNRLDYIVCIVRDINLPPYELLIKNEIKISNEYTLPSTLVKSHFTDTFYNKIKDLTFTGSDAILIDPITKQIIFDNRDEKLGKVEYDVELNQ